MLKDSNLNAVESFPKEDLVDNDAVLTTDAKDFLELRWLEPLQTFHVPTHKVHVTQDGKSGGHC